MADATHHTPGQDSILAPQTTKAKHFTSRTITLESGATKQLALGSYSQADKKPKFTITSTPDVGEHLAASYEVLDIPGSKRYIAFYHLHNFDARRCDVTITKAY